MRTVIIAPMSREAKAIGRGVIVCAHAADLPASLLRPPASGNDATETAVLIAGVCGGLDPSLAPGTLILGRKIVAEERPELTPSGGLFAAARSALRRQRTPFVSSLLLTTARPLASGDAKRDAWNTHGAAGVDMESYELAEALDAAGVPWLVLRSVLDPASSVLPAPVARWTSETDDREIARAALMTPRDWPAYARLALELRSSLRALRRGVPVVTGAVSRVDDLRAPEPRAAAVDLPIVTVS
jgi:adenosylhomocysteine nucleosidase